MQTELQEARYDGNPEQPYVAESAYFPENARG